MPRTTRDELLRLQEQADNDLERCLKNMKRMTEIYSSTGQHNQYVQNVELVAQQIVTIQDLWNRFRDEVM